MASNRQPRVIFSPTHILVSPRQKGNPLLECFRHVSYKFEERLVPDYVINATTCALFLSVKYHLRRPTYIQQRFHDLRRKFTVRVLVCCVDVVDSAAPLAVITQLCVRYGWSLMCCWSYEEACTYIESLKTLEKKSDKYLRGTKVNALRLGQTTGQELSTKEHSDVYEHLLTMIRSVNTTDVQTLYHNVGNFSELCSASQRRLQGCPGLGPKKIRNIWSVLHAPFRSGGAIPLKRKDTTEKKNNKAS